MATTAPARPTPASRRSPPSLSSSTSPPSSIAKGATARSAANARASASLSSPGSRRGSVKATTPSPVVNGETRESLSASLKEETEQKEKLLVQLQDKEQTITQLTSENNNLTSSLNAAETRLQELYADQSRMEEEMAARLEVMEKLRTQVRDLEKEKRDLQRRYNEQTTTFEAERQAFYDNEQHLKSRIQSLTQARKQPPPVLTSPSVVSVAESETDVEEQPVETPPAEKQDLNDPEQEPAEMTALRLELSTLSISYNSLQSTLALLQTQLHDLKRVNNELQEENESYNILLREKTLNGQFDILRMGGTSVTEPSDSSEAGDDDDNRDAESLLSRNTSRSVLDPVDERDERVQEPEPMLDPEFQQDQPDRELADTESPAKAPRRGGRRRTTSQTSSRSPAPRGESLANIGVTGPGLDLAAELGRAENKDLVEGRASLDTDRSILNNKGKRGRKSTDRKVSAMSEGAEASRSPDDLEILRSEVKNLKDANKALSLYASKIIDRIISQEGFEHVLAVDYDKAASPPPQSAKFTTFSDIPKSPAVGPPPKKTRPQSAIFSSLSSNSGSVSSPPQERLTTFDDIRAAAAAAKSANNSPPAPAPNPRQSRRSLSFDWSKFSMFGGGAPEKKPELRPLTLKAGAPSVVANARKLDTQEDEEDRRERERLHATMKLMGIEKPASPAMPSMGKSYSSPAGGAEVLRTPATASTVTPGTAVPMTPATSSRFSFFRRTNSDASSVHSSPALGGTPNLTQEALEQAEAESAIAALDAHERQLSVEIAKGSPGGFTEIVRRSGDRRSSRRSGSGSTVWSAGMSKGEGDDD
ncbi:hypothetical protein L226DRAFT_12884 [Lentinus tigrinus ALCF2SS1-7]|uniref:uncharacterized protein n=1 Tax=Lentinus tigrinus ALCF2SS1-7 TaxID=1328758 RepID=UPI001165D03E|nr:hypothetical protein L226DRAFT_12884 [Lentinus tigrinus ALCF2SS1-7]